MNERIFSFENKTVQKMFCSIMHSVYGLSRAEYLSVVPTFIYINLDRNHVREVYVSTKSSKPTKVITEDTINAMQLLVNQPETLTALLFN